MLLIEADNNLRFDRPVPKPRHNGLLNVGYGPRGGRNFAGVRHIYAALLIDGLSRQIDKVSRACTRRLPWREQTAGSRLENRYVQRVTNADHLGWLGALIRKLPPERDHVGL